MPFCTRCGVEFTEGAAYCASCGSATRPAPSSPPVAPDPLGISMNVAALLAYVLFFISGIFFLLVEPYKQSRYVRFHAFQSIFYSVAYFVLSVAHSTLLVFFVAMPVLGTRSLVSMIWGFISLAFFVGWVVLMVKAYQNERFMLPIIGPLAAQYAG
ncbi:MAG: hypothetical protein ACRD18_05990 [Terriglobia bacterium]